MKKMLKELDTMMFDKVLKELEEIIPRLIKETGKGWYSGMFKSPQFTLKPINIVT